MLSGWLQSAHHVGIALDDVLMEKGLLAVKVMRIPCDMLVRQLSLCIASLFRTMLGVRHYPM